MTTAVRIPMPLPVGAVSGLWSRPGDAMRTVALAHGAGAGMTHPFLEGLAEALTALVTGREAARPGSLARAERAAERRATRRETDAATAAAHAELYRDLIRGRAS